MHDDTSCLKSQTALGTFHSLSVPVYRASTIVFPTVDAYRNRRDAMYDGYSYGLYGTPTSRELENRIAAIEGAARAMVLSSGFAAIVVATLANVRTGQRVLFPDTAYDTVRPFADRFLAGLGIHVGFYDPMLGSEIAPQLTEDVALLWVESPGSVTLEVQDLPAISSAARARGIKVAADNTYATAMRCKPLALGVDMSICALSKYVAGHSDVVMGSIAVNDEGLFRKLKDYARFMGQGVSADEASLAVRGMETMAVRLDRIESNAGTIAVWLSGQIGVDQVRHPALPGNPGHAMWQRDFSGATGLLTLFMAEWTRPWLADAVEALKLFAIGASWGGTKSVIAVLDQVPMRSATARPHDGPVLRLSIGLEHPDDLKADLVQFLATLAQHCPGAQTAAGGENS